MGYPMLRRGSRGSAVRVLQGALNERQLEFGQSGAWWGPPLDVDGAFGPITESRVKVFQFELWLIEDGIVGPATWAGVLANEHYVIEHRVTLKPQRNESSCWLAVTEMLLGRSLTRAEIQARVPRQFLAPDGGLFNETDIQADGRVLKAYAESFGLRFFSPKSWPAAKLAEVMRRGPVAVNELLNLQRFHANLPTESHWLVLGDIRGDGTEAGTTVRVYDPLPVNQGQIFRWGYKNLVQQFPGMSYQLLQKR